MINHTISYHDDVMCRYTFEHYRVVLTNRMVLHNQYLLR